MSKQQKQKKLPVVKKQQIAKLRKLVGMTQQQVADKSGYEVKTVQRMEQLGYGTSESLQAIFGAISESAKRQNIELPNASFQELLVVEGSAEAKKTEKTLNGYLYEKLHAGHRGYPFLFDQLAPLERTLLLAIYPEPIYSLILGLDHRVLPRDMRTVKELVLPWSPVVCRAGEVTERNMDGEMETSTAVLEYQDIGFRLERIIEARQTSFVIEDNGTPPIKEHFRQLPVGTRALRDPIEKCTTYYRGLPSGIETMEHYYGLFDRLASLALVKPRAEGLCEVHIVNETGRENFLGYAKLFTLTLSSFGRPFVETLSQHGVR